jgi:hypothetical protein
MTKETSPISRLTATLDEVASKVRALMTTSCIREAGPAGN